MRGASGRGLDWSWRRSRWLRCSRGGAAAAAAHGEQRHQASAQGEGEHERFHGAGAAALALADGMSSGAAHQGLMRRHASQARSSTVRGLGASAQAASSSSKGTRARDMGGAYHDEDFSRASRMIKTL